MDVTRATPLPGRLSWMSSISATFSGEALPDTERIALGGRYAVRGYSYDDVSVDSGIIWRNELRLPSFSPYFFADLGFGRDHTTDRNTTLGGLGVGFDYNIADNFTASFVAGLALGDGGNTNAGDWNTKAQ